MASLDAAANFEEGIEAVEQLEYSSALRAFASAAGADSRNPLPWAWKARTAWLMRQDAMAVEAADTAGRLVTSETPPYLTAFTRAVVAEARRDIASADAAYRQLAEMRHDESQPLVELAAFQDRQARNRDAIQTYQRALALDDTLLRPRLELCRLYNRVNESAAAREQADRLMNTARTLGDWALETQGMFCLVDVLRVGSSTDRNRAREYAQAAVDILANRSAGYQLSRGYYYLGLAAAAAGDLSDAVADSERAVGIARREGNLLLEPLVLMNIGAAYERLGNRLRAGELYDESSKAYERLGEEARAAQIEANRGALLIEYGDNPDEGRRNLDNALAVVRKLGDKNFEVFCLQVIAANERNSGRHAEAVKTLNQALAIARERDLKDEIASLTIDIARSRYDLADYSGARQLLTEALRDASGPRIPEARLRLAMTLSRLQAPGAADEFRRASDLVAQAAPDPTLVGLKHLAAGQLALAAGRLAEASREFAEASPAWADAPPDATAVEARIYLGLVRLRQGRYEEARGALDAGLKKAGSMRRYALEVRARLYLADWCLAMNRGAEALEVLKSIRPDDRQAAGPELQAEIQQRRSEATRRLGTVTAMFDPFGGEA